MFATVALVVLTQVSVPLVPADAAPSDVAPDAIVQTAPKGPMHWIITTPILGAFAGAGAGFMIAGSRLRPTDNAAPVWTAGALIGAGVGAGLGFVAGYFAREGSVVGKIASVALWVLGGSAVTTAAAVGGALGLVFLSASQGSSFLPIY